jgi:DNA (cytosine-5)-methyltransferase 1
MKHGSLFSGIGGFDLAAEWIGWENVFHCEWNEFCQRVLHYYWRKSIQYNDITKTDFTIHRGRIDVLTGGFPCQPYSAAGKRLGKDDERHLWPHMLRAIREIQPRWVVGENVRGLVNWNGGLVFDEVQSDLEAEGYEVLPFLVPACGKDAPHRRERVWFVAYNIGKGLEGSEPTTTIDNDRNGLFRNRAAGGCLRGEASDTSNERPTPHTCDQGLQGRKNERGVGGIGQKRNEQLAGCVQSAWQNFPTQPPVCGGDDGLPTELDGITVSARKGRRPLSAKQSFSKWRNESIKAYGNAVVPQVVYEIFKAIEAYENA